MLTAEERRFVQQLPVSNNYAIELLNDWLKFSVAKSTRQLSANNGASRICVRTAVPKTGDDGAQGGF